MFFILRQYTTADWIVLSVSLLLGVACGYFLTLKLLRRMSKRSIPKSFPTGACSYGPTISQDVNRSNSRKRNILDG